MKFKSAVAPWFYFLTLVLPAAIIIYVVLSIGTISATGMAAIGVVAVLTLGIPLWLLFTTYYLVKDGTLKIRSGPVNILILLSDIKSVKPSRSWLSSPALSLKRLEIVYGRSKKVLVSPKDLEGFKRAIGQV